MARKQTPRGRKGPTKSSGIEWTAGIMVMPAYVTDEGGPYRPEVLFWIGADGMLLGSATGRRGELPTMVSESLRQTIEAPLIGKPHAPTRVRVVSPEAADALRAEHPELDVVCELTPQTELFLEALSESLSQEEPPERSYLSGDCTPDAMAGFFKASAALFRAEPWRVVPSDQCVLAVTIEQLGVRDLVVSVMGHLGRMFGVAVFWSFDDFEAFSDAGDVLALGHEPRMAPELLLSFERGAELPPGLRKEVSAHRWEVADARAYPWLAAIDEDLVSRPPTRAELTMVEAIALALTQLAAEREVWAEAWDEATPTSRTYSVAAHEGELAVALSAPSTRPVVEIPPSGSVLYKLASLSRDAGAEGEIDSDAYAALQEELLERFSASAEAKNVEDTEACYAVMDLAVRYLGVTIATLSATDLREVIFDLVPRKVSVDSDQAKEFIEDLRAFYSFLKREYALPQADSCLRALGSNTVAKLEAALEDSDNHSLAKSFVTAGAEAGFDMDSEEGLVAWMESTQGKDLSHLISLPSVAPQRTPPKKAAKAKRDKRKATRKARKKSR